MTNFDRNLNKKKKENILNQLFYNDCFFDFLEIEDLDIEWFMLMIYLLSKKPVFF